MLGGVETLGSCGQPAASVVSAVPTNSITLRSIDTNQFNGLGPGGCRQPVSTDGKPGRTNSAIAKMNTISFHDDGLD